jgi:hypothetical protein
MSGRVDPPRSFKPTPKQEEFFDKLLNSKTGFEPNAIIRGAQLTLVGSMRESLSQIRSY